MGRIGPIKPEISEKALNKVVPRVKCAICGQEMLRITRTHLQTKHGGITIAEYTEKYGAPELIGGKDLILGNKTKLNGKLSEQTYNECLELARKGYPRRTICQTVGISYQTLMNWLSWGAPDCVDKEGNRIYPDLYYDFHIDFERAEAFAETTAVDLLRDAGKGDWRAVVEFLQRRFPENWRVEKKTTLEVGGQVSLQVPEIGVNKLLEDPELAEMACNLLEKLSEGDRDVVDVEAVEVPE